MTGSRTAGAILLIAMFALLGGSGLAKAGSAGEINAGVSATLDRFYRQIPGSQALVDRTWRLWGSNP